MAPETSAPAPQSTPWEACCASVGSWMRRRRCCVGRWRCGRHTPGKPLMPPCPVMSWRALCKRLVARQRHARCGCGLASPASSASMRPAPRHRSRRGHPCAAAAAATPSGTAGPDANAATGPITSACAEQSRQQRQQRRVRHQRRQGSDALTTTACSTLLQRMQTCSHVQLTILATPSILPSPALHCVSLFLTTLLSLTAHIQQAIRMQCVKSSTGRRDECTSATACRLRTT